MLVRNILVLSIISFIPYTGYCQFPQTDIDPGHLSELYFKKLKKEFGYSKQYPVQFEKQILIALSYYPELKNTSILFQVRTRHSIALTRATWGGVFESIKKRHYLITISDSTEPILMPVLFKNLSFNSQVGVIGHELAHVVQYSAKTTPQMIKYILSNISSKYIDRFEYNADAICIEHGLGYQLLEWSTYIRKTMNSENWVGPDYANRPKKRERYMNPVTIRKHIERSAIYH